MSIKCISKGSGKVICKFDGRMDTAKCIDAERKIMQAIKGVDGIIFDLAGVKYIASSFLRLCGKASHKVVIGNFSIINVTPAVKKVFKIAGLSERLNLK